MADGKTSSRATISEDTILLKAYRPGYSWERLGGMLGVTPKRAYLRYMAAFDRPDFNGREMDAILNTGQSRTRNWIKRGFLGRPSYYKFTPSAEETGPRVYRIRLEQVVDFLRDTYYFQLYDPALLWGHVLDDARLEEARAHLAWESRVARGLYGDRYVDVDWITDRLPIGHKATTRRWFAEEKLPGVRVPARPSFKYITRLEVAQLWIGMYAECGARFIAPHVWRLAIRLAWFNERPAPWRKPVSLLA